MIAAARRAAGSAVKGHPKRSTRASISFPPRVYEELERIAMAKKVSIAWVVREAAEKYVADQWPLLEQPQLGGRS